MRIGQNLKTKVLASLLTFAILAGMIAFSTSSVSAWSAPTSSGSPGSGMIGSSVTYTFTLSGSDNTLQVSSVILSIDWGSSTATNIDADITSSGPAEVPGGESGTYTYPFVVPEVSPQSYTASITVTARDLSDPFETANPNTFDYDFTVESIPLTVTVDANPMTSQTPLMTTLTATASGGYPDYLYEWDFGDGTIGEGAITTHQYVDIRSYTAACTVTDRLGQTARDTVTIRVQSNPVNVTISASKLTGTAPLDTTFTLAMSGGLPPYRYLWNFGDGNTSTEQRPSHQYMTYGRFTATCVVTDSAGQSGMDNVTIYVQAEPLQVTIEATSTSGQAPFTTTLSVTTNGGAGEFTYLWKFGDGSSSTVANPEHTYSGVGPYQTTCLVSDSEGHTGSDSITITVLADEISHVEDPSNNSSDLYLGMAIGIMAIAGLAAIVWMRKMR
jgi:PKD repeat protein